MHDSELEELFERIEITIAMQERMLLPNAERGDETIDRLAYRATAAAQETIVSRRVPRTLLSKPTVNEKHVGSPAAACRLTDPGACATGLLPADQNRQARESDGP